VAMSVQLVVCGGVGAWAEAHILMSSAACRVHPPALLMVGLRAADPALAHSELPAATHIKERSGACDEPARVARRSEPY
jgi:hypothetical protein